ncbi:MAG: SDR family oxidoreductase [Dehalococcoidia bacterium]|nr:SDR family oxidoreductase [Dehalococcoidia bacterium]
MKDKTIFITGGNAGIGLATARLFSQHGANVAIMSRRPEKNKAAKAEIEALGGKCIAFVGDVSKESDVKSAIEETFKTFGSLHYAFNNAAATQTPKPLTDQVEEEFYAVFDVTVKGAWLCMKHEIPYMLKSGGGSIVINSSASGHTGTVKLPLYSAAKHALLGLTKSIALEYAKQNIRVNAVCPGAIHTGSYGYFAKKDPAMKAAVEAAHPMGRIGLPEEVALGVLYLCRDATFTTGSSLMIEGGRTAQ